MTLYLEEDEGGGAPTLVARSGSTEFRLTVKEHERRELVRIVDEELREEGSK